MQATHASDDWPQLKKHLKKSIEMCATCGLVVTQLASHIGAKHPKQVPKWEKIYCQGGPFHEPCAKWFYTAKVERALTHMYKDVHLFVCSACGMGRHLAKNVDRHVETGGGEKKRCKGAVMKTFTFEKALLRAIDRGLVLKKSWKDPEGKLSRAK